MTARDHVDAYEGECLREFPAAEIREGRVVAPKAFAALRAVLDVADDCRNITGARAIGDTIESAITTALEAS